MGRPGAGKTTLGKIISSRIGYELVTAGDVARKLAETDEEVRDALARGQLAPKDKMNEAMAAKISLYQILDGYPRYLDQLDQLYIRARTYRTIPLFIKLNCDATTAAIRLYERRRSDDTPEAIAHRQSTWDHDTSRLFNMDIARNDTITIDATQSPEEVAFDAIRLLKEAHASLFR